MAKLTTNEQILDRYIRHQTYLLRYAGGLRNEVLPILAKTEAELYATVEKWVAKSGVRTLTGVKGRKWQRDFEKALVAVRGPAWDKVNATITAQLKDLAINEAATGAVIIEGAVPVSLNMTLPPAAQLIGIVNSQPFEGRTLKGWLRVTETADVQRMLKATKRGIVQGLTPTQVARSIIGTKIARYADGDARKAFRDTEAVILTLTNGVQNEAKQALYEANKDVIKREQYVATLDARTTLECAGNDGKTFPQGKGPIPPLHFRCRSLRVPYLNPENLGNRGYDSRTEKELLTEFTTANKLPPVKSRDALPHGTKTKFDKYARGSQARLVGQVPAKTTYNMWLKAQTNEFQDQVLGPTRAKMFRKGNIALDKFVARDGDVLTLDQLKRKGLEVPD